MKKGFVLKKEIEEVLGNYGISVRTIENVYDDSDNTPLGYKLTLEWWTGLGENIIEDISIPLNYQVSNIAEEIDRLKNSFDVDDHVESLIQYRGTHGVPNSISALVEDAQKLEEMYEKLSDELWLLAKNK